MMNDELRARIQKPGVSSQNEEGFLLFILAAGF
jgi:hypothetical protein